MTTKAEAVQRAFDHHQVTGRLTFVSPPAPGDPKWRVRLANESMVYHLTTAQAFTLAEMLAYMERQMS